MDGTRGGFQGARKHVPLWHGLKDKSLRESSNQDQITHGSAGLWAGETQASTIIE